MAVAEIAVDDYKSLTDAYVDEEHIDQNEATTGGGNFEPPAAGRGFARLVEYIELGAHIGTYQGKPKKKADHEVRIVMELSGRLYPPTEMADGTLAPQRLYFRVAISSLEKSRFYKLFRALNGMYGDKYKHFSQMVADNIAFIVTITHRDNGKLGADKRVYANIWAGGAWKVEAALRRDDEAGTSEPINVVKALTPTCIFLFNRPRLVDWAKLFIDGERDDGTSKNWIQDTITSAVNFENSPIQALLIDLPIDVAPEKTSGKAATKPAKAASAKADPLNDI